VTFGLTVTIPCIGLVTVLSEAVISTSYTYLPSSKAAVCVDVRLKVIFPVDVSESIAVVKDVDDEDEYDLRICAAAE
jgi:hypothetical protein